MFSNSNLCGVYFCSDLSGRDKWEQKKEQNSKIKPGVIEIYEETQDDSLEIQSLQASSDGFLNISPFSGALPLVTL